MVILLFIIGVALVAATGRLVAYALALPSIQLRDHLRDIGLYGFQNRADTHHHASRRPLKDRFAVFAERTGSYMIDRVTALRPLARGELAAAAYYDVSPEAVHGYRAIAAVASASLVALIAFASVGVTPVALLVVIVAGAAGWQLPAVVIRRRGRLRLEQVDKDLPELIDLLIATIEAGMGLAGSLELVAGRLTGPLGEEVRFTSRQHNLGISTTRALDDMLERCDTPSMRAFVKTVVRGETMGLSIAPILRELTIDIRRRRRQAAEERMHKAPVKILFPLMFLVMPSLGIVLFYPAAYSLIKGLSGHGV
jgi:tight adherence protein C